MCEEGKPPRGQHTPRQGALPYTVWRAKSLRRGVICTCKSCSGFGAGRAPARAHSYCKRAPRPVASGGGRRNWCACCSRRRSTTSTGRGTRAANWSRRNALCGPSRASAGCSAAAGSRAAAAQTAGSTSGRGSAAQSQTRRAPWRARAPGPLANRWGRPAGLPTSDRVVHARHTRSSRCGAPLRARQARGTAARRTREARGVRAAAQAPCSWAPANPNCRRSCTRARPSAPGRRGRGFAPPARASRRGRRCRSRAARCRSRRPRTGRRSVAAAVG
mmetsp:Transcript_91926/g.275926  ORF Transcript_91926/g.275926 Transcript_91926/m.275926 type:complete len:275 (-) Transcript_91926:387-1211(-)